MNNFSNLDSPTEADINSVATIAQVEMQLDVYRAAASRMSVDELEDEKHQSKRLSEYLKLANDLRPHPKCHAHAIVSGQHKQAARLRAVLAWLKVRIDDPANGCWLPENTAALANMPERLKNAVPHSRIHRFNYYFWLREIINLRRTRNEEQLRRTLSMIETRLQAGSQPTYVMNRKGVGLPR